MGISILSNNSNIYENKKPVSASLMCFDVIVESTASFGLQAMQDLDS